MSKQWISRTLVAAVAASAASIFLSQLLFFLAVVFWVMWARERREWRLEAPPFFALILLFLGAVVLAILFSTNVLQSSLYLKKTLKLFYVLLFFTFFTASDLKTGLRLLLAVLGASAVLGILQYFWFKDVDLMNRIDGFMSHWMTFSGQMMMGSLALVAYLLFGRAPSTPKWMGVMGWTGLLAVLIFALVLSMTRSALAGFLVGLTILLAVYSRRWASLAAAATVGAFLLLPGHFQERMLSAFDPTDVTTRGRLEYLQTGANVVNAHPWTGVGPRMFPRLFEEYRVSPDFPDWSYQHLHNNMIHIAAEMGLPALLAWLAIWLRVYWDLIRFARAPVDRLAFFLSINGISVLTAFLFAGLFEYNFGDSELLIVLLFFITAPYVGQLRRKEAA